MANLSQLKRQRMLDFLNKIKEEHKEDDSALIAINEIESELNDKKYGLVWEEHQEQVDVEMIKKVPVFSEIKDKEIVVDKNLPYNFLLEGDNLHSLKLLEKTHKGKIDVIYIDPPYNTGGTDFVYDDKYIGADDTFRHSKWLSFMNERLLFARELLSPKGIIFISIDDNEVAQLKMLCDEIFGESNHINTITINMNSLSGVKMTHAINGKRFPAQKEYMLLYKRGLLPITLQIEKKRKEKWDKEYNLIIPELEPMQFEKFNDMDEKEVNEILSQCSLSSLSSYASVNNIKITEQWLWDNAFRIFGSKSNRPLAKRIKDKAFPQQIICYTNNDGNKRYFRSDFNREVRDPRIELVQAEANSSVFLSDNWIDISNDGGVGQEGGVIFPNGKKPLSLITRILKTSNNANAIVLDFFAGSGTTAQAVIELNNEDNGNRKFILCTNNENNICEAKTYQRVKNVISGYGNHDGIPANLKYYKTDFIDKFSDDEDYSVNDELLKHIAEMVQLEYAVRLDEKNYVLLLSDDEADGFIANDESLSKCSAVYVSTAVLLTAEQEKKLKDNGIKVFVIPDYYFENELQEAGES